MEGVWVYLTPLLVILLILYFWRQQRSLRTFPPGPLPLPFIGSLWRTGFGYREDTLIKLAKQYGNIYTLWMANLPVVVLSGFHAVKEGLVNHLEELSDRPLTPFFRVIGREMGVALSNGHTWKQQRRFGLHSLRKLGLGKKNMESQIEAEAQQLVEIFAREKGQPFDPSMAITNSISNMICAVTFGQRFSLEDENFKKLIEALDLGVMAIGSFSHAGYPPTRDPVRNTTGSQLPAEAIPQICRSNTPNTSVYP